MRSAISTRPPGRARGNRFLFDYSESMDPELQEVFDLAVSRGINLFDTADSYGTGRLNGRSEQLLGQFTRCVRSRGARRADSADTCAPALCVSRARGAPTCATKLPPRAREYPGSAKVRDGIHIATKLASYPWRVTPGNMVAACKGSLRRLGADSLSLGQLHWSAAKYAPLQEWALWCGARVCVSQGGAACGRLCRGDLRQRTRVRSSATTADTHAAADTPTPPPPGTGCRTATSRASCARWA